MRLVSISGTRNSGKTTLIVELLRRLNQQRLTSAVIVNEKGDATYEPCRDMARVVEIQYIRGG